MHGLLPGSLGSSSILALRCPGDDRLHRSGLGLVPVDAELTPQDDAAKIAGQGRWSRFERVDQTIRVMMVMGPMTRAAAMNRGSRIEGSGVIEGVVIGLRDVYERLRALDSPHRANLRVTQFAQGCG